MANGLKCNLGQWLSEVAQRKTHGMPPVGFGWNHASQAASATLDFRAWTLDTFHRGGSGPTPGTGGATAAGGVEGEGTTGGGAGTGAGAAPGIPAAAADS